ncbi:uncharacterized protein Triagg1_2349 [Trichoderma aggressivum f. europaeum]|uniref:Uncharacterized protein n=1 Tax=Trichoderma aggressivum f. europaeum TaxID=173218 RepID=A0AAE1IHW6_9HYPO|nr:hypothetical protein Triagg1_2349 [Trichoderma aggressivum f. europaeum]
MSTASTKIHPPHPQENGRAEAPGPSRGTKNTMATIKLMFSGKFRYGQPNPVHVAIATRGYDIQSRVLRIPDGFGWFTRGPPRRSAFEGHAFVVAILSLLFVAVMFSGCISFI